MVSQWKLNTIKVFHGDQHHQTMWNIPAWTCPHRSLGELPFLFLTIVTSSLLWIILSLPYCFCPIGFASTFLGHQALASSSTNCFYAKTINFFYISINIQTKHFHNKYDLVTNTWSFFSPPCYFFKEKHSVIFLNQSLNLRYLRCSPSFLCTRSPTGPFIQLLQTNRLWRTTTKQVFLMQILSEEGSAKRITTMTT